MCIKHHGEVVSDLQEEVGAGMHVIPQHRSDL